jgi:hypothetical protein
MSMKAEMLPPCPTCGKPSFDHDRFVYEVTGHFDGEVVLSVRYADEDGPSWIFFCPSLCSCSASHHDPAAPRTATTSTTTGRR